MEKKNDECPFAGLGKRVFIKDSDNKIHEINVSNEKSEVKGFPIKFAFYYEPTQQDVELSRLLKTKAIPVSKEVFELLLLGLKMINNAYYV